MSTPRVADQPAGEPREVQPLTSRAATLLVGIVAIVVYLNALGGQFVNDAFFAIAENRALQQSKEWLAWLTRDYYWGSTLHDTTLYRPLTIMSWLAHLRTTGVTPLAFLQGNVLLHAGVSVLVLWVGERLVGRSAGLVGALIFAVHPLHTEAVAWVMGRAELLAAVFALGACLGFLRATDPAEPRAGWFSAGTVAAYLAALLSKEHVALLPVWFGLVWAVERSKRSGRQAAYVGVGSVVALAVFLALRAQALTRPVQGESIIGLYNPAAVVSTPLRWLTAAAAAGRYAWLVVWPARLSIDYSYAETRASTGLGLAELGGIVVILAVLGTIVVAVRRAWGVGLALALAPITFVLVSNFPFPIGTIMAERLTYLPSVGLCLGAGWLLTRFPLPPAVLAGSRRMAEPEVTLPTRRIYWGWAVLGVIVGLSVALSVRTMARNRDWTDAYTLAAATLQASPRSAAAHAGMGSLEARRGNDGRAMELLQEALRIYPANPPVLNVRGGILMRRGAFHEAAAEYRKAIALAPAEPPLHSNLGIALQRIARFAEAEQELSEAIRLAPRSPDIRVSLGGLLLEMRRPAEALIQFREAARLDPGDPVPQYGMARAALELGDRHAAADYARRAAAAGFPVPGDFWRAVESSP